MKNIVLKTVRVAVLAAFCTAGMWSCKNDDTLPEGEQIFELSYEGESVEDELISFKLGETKTLSLYARYAPFVEIDVPTGWTCTVSVADEECVITAPSDEDAASSQISGKITFDITSRDGQKTSAYVNVAFYEGDMLFAFNNPDILTERQIFSFEESKQYEFTADNVFDLDIAAPKGWEAVYIKGNSFIAVKAPAENADSPEMEGYVSVTPKSPLGESGTTQKIQVIVDALKPSVSFEKDTYTYLFSAAGETIPFTPLHVETATVLSSPEGWTASVDPAGTITVSAPGVTDLEADGIGKIVLQVENDLGTKAEYEVTVRLKGIAGDAEFMAFCEDFAADRPLDKYMQDGALVFAGDVDLGKYTDKSVFVAEKEGGFDYPINGWGRTVKLNITSSGPYIGLFHTIGANSTVSDLNVEGSITTDCETANFIVGGVSVRNHGGKFRNVTTNIDFTYAPATFKSVTSNYGSIVGVTVGGEYEKCVTDGTIHMNTGSMRRVGGMVGFVETTGCVVRECVNNGAINLAFGDNGANNCHYAGIVGNSEHIESSYYDCVNNGDISVDFAGKNKVLHSLGGIAGSSIGYFSGCKNYGNISANELNGSRRYGGITGSSASDKGKVEIVNCENRGNISHTSAFVGGIAGVIEKCTSSKVIGCTNYGNIENPHPSSLVENLSGLVAGFFGDEITDCANHGKVSGLVYKYAGGLIGRGQNGKVGKTTVTNCANYGELAPTTTAEQTNVMVCSGVVTIASGAYVLTNCTNTGAINSVVKQAGTTRNVWGYWPSVSAGQEDTATQADETSRTSQADTSKINETLAVPKQ